MLTLSSLLLFSSSSAAMSGPTDWWGVTGSVTLDLSNMTIFADAYLINPQSNGYIDMCVYEDLGGSYSCPGTWAREITYSAGLGSECPSFADVHADMYVSAYNEYGQDEYFATDLAVCPSGATPFEPNNQDPLCYKTQIFPEYKVTAFFC